MTFRTLNQCYNLKNYCFEIASQFIPEKHYVILLCNPLSQFNYLARDKMVVNEVERVLGGVVRMSGWRNCQMVCGHEHYVAVNLIKDQPILEKFLMGSWAKTNKSAISFSSHEIIANATFRKSCKLTLEQGLHSSHRTVWVLAVSGHGMVPCQSNTEILWYLSSKDQLWHHTAKTWSLLVP